MSSTPPPYAPSTPSPTSTPPTLKPASALVSAARTVYHASTHSSSSTAPSASRPLEKETEKEKERHHHHHHHHMHRHRHHRDSKSARDGILQSTTFGELLSPVKSVAGGLAGRLGSKGEGVEGKKVAGRGAGQGHVRSGAEHEARGKVEWADARRIRGRRAAAEAQLQKQLSSLQSAATTATRDLDTSYYSLLATLPNIHSTLSLLRNLATQSQALLDTFTHSSAPELTAEFETQIASLQENFDGVQSERIAGLEARMKAARERLRGLGMRMEDVRGTVQAWERREREGKARGRRNIGILWGVLGTVVGLFVVIVLYRGWDTGTEGLEEVARRQASLRTERMLGREEFGGLRWDRGAEGRGVERGRVGGLGSPPTSATKSSRLDAVLRTLDEL